MRCNFLSGELGDAVNCLLAGAAFNMMKRLNQLKRMPIMALLVLIQAVNAICNGLLSPKHYILPRLKDQQGYASLAT